MGGGCCGYFTSLGFGPEKQKQASRLEVWSHREMPDHKAVTFQVECLFETLKSVDHEPTRFITERAIAFGRESMVFTHFFN